ncbi:UDP-N-acetylmuramyl pentapeptide phosphotransferase/UDP-N-acetylglucosamine-1-phosphate transferase [Bradyrhizobium lablabi]|uniref:UDP-N-acetylmuramyl pentapeptide phosphotransferase/UDP-N-acetylglucosamine-1-phosphate transferase n=2 Tax=Bradyrhizobium lablabi TaxID=722472 RepID=A0A1M7BC72_9BRAD|nr:UDP-N-acetylmuramyl pentapeptide phosphotransferase/UDP-N-acetylglucosamine-1-phosphate transferase [Bradyrhizobium lablabi]
MIGRPLDVDRSRFQPHEFSDETPNRYAAGINAPAATGYFFMTTLDPHRAALALVIPVAAALICAGLIVVLRPLLQRYALARPNARSSHVTPTPQGGGIAVITATAIAVALTALLGTPDLGLTIPVVLAAASCLAAVGMIDDLRPIPVVPRLALQFAVVALLIATLPPQMRIFEAIPISLERALLILGLLWFVNLVNFMDGLDWMTVAEMLPITTALAAFALFGEAPPEVLPIALALAGALLGFAPFNRPVARLFLGDVGSLPIGLVTGWCLIELASRQHFAAALLLPLYYLADATITLFRRVAAGERFWDAHRSHFYQRATNHGFSVRRVIADVFLLNLVLAGLAAISIAAGSTRVDLATLALGALGVTIVLVRFSRVRTD